MRILHKSLYRNNTTYLIREFNVDNIYTLNKLNENNHIFVVDLSKHIIGYGFAYQYDDLSNEVLKYFDTMGYKIHLSGFNKVMINTRDYTIDDYCDEEKMLENLIELEESNMKVYFTYKESSYISISLELIKNYFINYSLH